MAVTLSEVQRHLPELRRQAESLMTGAGTMYRRTGFTAQNDDGEEVPTYVAEFTSACKVQGPSGDDTETRYVTIGGVERPVITAGLHLPWNLEVDEGWEFEITAISSRTPTMLLGKRYQIVGVTVKSQATALRCDVVELPQPEV